MQTSVASPLLSLASSTLQTLSVVIFRKNDARRLELLRSILKIPFPAPSVFLLRINKISVLPALYYSKINMPALRDLHLFSLADTNDQPKAIPKLTRRLSALRPSFCLGPSGPKTTQRTVKDPRFPPTSSCSMRSPHVKKHRQLRLSRTVRRLLVSEHYGAYAEKDTQARSSRVRISSVRLLLSSTRRAC